MLAKVLAFTPRVVTTLDAAREHFIMARYSECLAGLKAHNSPEAAILASRVYLRQQRPQEAVARLEAFPPYLDDTHELKASHYTLLSAALLRAGDSVDRVESALIEARAHVWSSPSIVANAEFDFYEGVRAWMTGDLASAREHAERALHREAPAIRVQALTLLGTVAAVKTDYGTQVDLLREALQTLDACDERDVGLEAGVLWNLVGPVNGLHLPEVGQQLTRRAEALAWTADVGTQHYHVMSNLAGARTLVGDHIGAFRFLRVATDVAPTAPLQLSGLLDRAFLAREIGDSVMAAEEFGYAEKLADQIAWDETTGEERIALRYLAELVAPINPDRAQRILDRYFALKQPLSPLLIASLDRRWRAEDCLARGIVAKSQGSVDQALRSFTEAFEIWSQIGYVWRATRAALELADICDDVRYRAYVECHIGEFPNSWLARRWRATTAVA